MSLVERLLRRWGYVKLARYGLALTPDGRAVVPVVPAVPVAPARQVDEDEWEWEIALARARAAAAEVMTALPPPPPQPLRSPPAPAPAPHVSAEWPLTLPLGSIDYHDYTDPTPEPVRPSRPAVRPVSRAGSPGSPGSPATVIPVPTLPSVATTGVKVAVPPPMHTTTRRFAKGTGPVDPMSDATSVGIAVAPPARPSRPVDDDLTMPGTPALLVGDRTTPGMAALPSVLARSRASRSR